MIHFPSWTRSSRREEGNPPAAPISTVASLFKGFKFLRKNREKADLKPSGKPKKSTPRTPPPRPPKALGPNSAFSLLSEVADSSTFVAHLVDDRIPGSKLNDRQPASPRHPPPGQQTPPESNTNASRQISSSTRPFRNVEPQMTYNNSARAPGKAMIDHQGTMHQSVVVSAPSSSLSSLNPMPLTIGGSPNPPQPFFTHPPIDPSSFPVVASSINEGGISTGGIPEQEANEPPPQDGNTPRLQSGPSVGSFVALKSRWSSTTNYTTEEEEPPSFFKNFKFRRSNKVNCDRQISGKAKKSSKNETKTTKAWVLPSFSRGSASSSRIPPPPPPTGFRSSQCGSPSTNDLAESSDHPLNSRGHRTPDPKINDRHGRSERDPPPGHPLPMRLERKVAISRRKVSFIQPGGDAGPQASYNGRHRAPAEALDVRRAMRQNVQKSSPTNLSVPPVQDAIHAKSTPVGIPSLTVDAKKDTSTKGSSMLSKSDCLPTARPLSASKATSLKTDDGCNGPKSASADLPICPHCHPTIAVCVHEGEEWANELPPQDDSDDKPRLATGPSVKSFVSLTRRRSSSTSGDSEEGAFGRVRGVATNQGDEEQVTSTFTARYVEAHGPRMIWR
ncbi:hypothetical protein FRC04_006608 [Tulasnella sp. 424]|nr:hypothetical protein FRC04_006608 [Tulasnella sp. 424]